MAEVPEAPERVDAAAWAAAVAAVRNYCGWHIAPSTTETITVDGPGGTALVLPSLHVTEITEVINDGNTVANPEWSVKGIVRGRWTGKLRGVTVSLTHGYDTLPDEIVAIATDLAGSGRASEFDQLQTGPFQGSYSAAAQAGVVGLAGLQRAMLDRYRLPVRP